MTNPTAINTIKPIITLGCCPRCACLLTQNYDYEPYCVQCGWVDYLSEPLITEKSSPNVTAVFSGTVYTLRYSGPDPKMKNILLRHRIEKTGVHGRLANVVFCPFTLDEKPCGADMEHTSLSGKRFDMGEKRYHCPVGHALSLITTDGGVTSWR